MLHAIAMLSLAAAQPVTFTEHVAPILMDHCVSCHRPGEVAPMSLLTFDEVRPWAKGIRKAVAERQMPPWDADPSVGRFTNDISLTEAEIDTIVSWVDVGAPRGPEGAMPAPPEFPAGWKLGEPDLVVDMGAFDVPAEGEDLFITKAVRLDMPEDRWIQAVDVLVDNRQVLHHLVGIKGFLEMETSGVNLVDPGLQITPAERQQVDIFSIWAAGSPPTEYPEGMGYMFAKDQLLSFNIHYHPYGTAATDHSKVGLYFGEGELQREMVTRFGMNTGIRIAPNSVSEEYFASYVFGEDSRIISFFPHMHQRGKVMRYELTTPGGDRRTLLNVPDYDFNWQWIYYPEDGVRVPAGSRLDVFARFDNTDANPNNPDPSVPVAFGEGSNEEMLIGFFSFVSEENTVPAAPESETAVRTLLAAHPAEESYALNLTFLGGPRQWGLHFPEKGDATLYVVEPTRGIATITADATERHGRHGLVFRGKLVVDAGKTIPMGVYLDTADPANVTGYGLIGMPIPENPESINGTFPVTGSRLSTGAMASAAR